MLIMMPKVHNRIIGCLECLLVIFGVICVLQYVPESNASPLPGQDEERYVERDYQNSSPGAHELATWLIAQLRQSNNNAASNAASTGCRYPNLPKRNSEIINSMLRFPPIENGRK